MESRPAAVNSPALALFCASMTAISAIPDQHARSRGARKRARGWWTSRRCFLTWFVFPNWDVRPPQKYVIKFKFLIPRPPAFPLPREILSSPLGSSPHTAPFRVMAGLWSELVHIGCRDATRPRCADPQRYLPCPPPGFMRSHAQCAMRVRLMSYANGRTYLDTDADCSCVQLSLTHYASCLTFRGSLQLARRMLLFSCMRERGAVLNAPSRMIVAGMALEPSMAPRINGSNHIKRLQRHKWLQRSLHGKAAHYSPLRGQDAERTRCAPKPLTS